MTTGRPSPVFISGIALVILGALVLPSALAKPKPNHKPDLAVKHAEIQGKGFALIGRRADIQVKDTIENVGKAKAGPTVNEVRIHGRGKHFEHTSRAVPALEPGKDNQGEGTARIDIPANTEPGMYAITLCADAKDQENEEDELDNCKTLGDFFLIEPRWEGTLKVTGHASGTGGKEVGTMSDAVFSDPVEAGHQGVFRYTLHGSVTYTDSGSDSGGCNFSGGTTDDNPTGSLTLSYESAKYSGNGLSQKHYAISDPPCNRGLQGPGEPAFLVTTRTNGQFQHLDSGAKHIGATNNFFGSIFTWSLDGTG